MNKQRVGAPGGIKIGSVKFNRILPPLFAFIAGAMCAHAFHTTLRKAELMGHPYRAVKLINLASVTQESLGLGHLRSCESKVQRLHDVLSSTTMDIDTQTEHVETYIASILIDGRSCNKYLVQHLGCHQGLPPFYLYSEIRSVFIYDINFAPLLKDEQGLILFLLHRINPEALLFSPEYFYGCEETTEEERRAFLVYEWNYLYGEDAPPGILESLFKRLFN